MAKSKTVSRAQVSSLVKKDIAALRAHANRLNDFLKSPGAAAIRICECCINVSMPDPGAIRSRASKRSR